MPFRKYRPDEDPAPEIGSPLAEAVHRREKGTLTTVAEALRHRQAVLAYQPVLQAGTPHQLAFYEGLIRIRDEAGRIVPARDFMSAVESHEIGREIDCTTLDLGLETLALNPSIRLSLNMSARSIGYPKWFAVLERHLAQNPTLGERLMLEISEQSAMPMPELVIDFMLRLQPQGIAFALDNFGSGATSFSAMRDFFFDAAKIDGQFAQGLHANPDNQAVVRALIAVARQFDMLIIAEHVEELEDAELLAELGVDCLQGYLFGAPSLRPPWGETQPRQQSA